MKIQAEIGLRVLIGMPLALFVLFLLRARSLEEVGSGTVMVVVVLAFSLAEAFLQGARAYLRARQERRAP